MSSSFPPGLLECYEAIDLNHEHLSTGIFSSSMDSIFSVFRKLRESDLFEIQQSGVSSPGPLPLPWEGYQMLEDEVEAAVDYLTEAASKVSIRKSVKLQKWER